ncbi:unnamed protein product [Rhizoctonia solani]|uniref:Uncharacterized protein n=1 Tax=Rhizoctonia solani TaxID=456999 RepID=A0A8H3C782_9AGAM|nr:unnamed protein product [Rhizoctonia solani]
MAVAMVRTSGYNRIHSALTSESFAELYYPPAYDRYHESNAECLDLTDTVDLEARIRKFFFPNDTSALKSREQNGISCGLHLIPSPLPDSSTVGLGLGMQTKFGVFLSESQPPRSNDEFLFPHPSKPPVTPIAPPPSNESEDDEETRRLAPFVATSESAVEALRLESRLQNQRGRERAPVSRRDIPRRIVNQIGAPLMRRSDTLGLHYSNYSITSSNRSTPPAATPKRMLRMSESSAKRELLPLGGRG